MVGVILYQEGPGVDERVHMVYFDKKREVQNKDVGWAIQHQRIVVNIGLWMGDEGYDFSNGDVFSLLNEVPSGLSGERLSKSDMESILGELKARKLAERGLVDVRVN